MIARVIPLPARIINCRRCGGHFRAKARHHAICPTCYWWGRALRALRIAERAFNELRKGGAR